MATALPETSRPLQQTMQDFLKEIAIPAVPSQATGTAVTVTFSATPRKQSPKEWLESTTKALTKLPWEQTNLPDGATPPQTNAAAALLRLLPAVLNDNTPPPSITSTWQGGISAEWHINQIDLEITCQPDGTMEFYFARSESEDETIPPEEEDEGIIGEDLARIKEYAEMLLPK